MSQHYFCFDSFSDEICIILTEFKLCFSRYVFCIFTDKYATVKSICLFWYVFPNGEFYIKPIEFQKVVTEFIGYVFSRNRKKKERKGGELR